MRDHPAGSRRQSKKVRLNRTRYKRERLRALMFERSQVRKEAERRGTGSSA